jgi:quercetin dioxygenase-like cupin family protein
METWDVTALDLEPHRPSILSSQEAGRVIALSLPAGERLQEHEVHERAWLVVLDGEIEVSSAGGEPVAGRVGLVTEFNPRERHEVVARADARLLLVLAPWPGDGHPGAMSLEDKAHARQRAREHQTDG